MKILGKLNNALKLIKLSIIVKTRLISSNILLPPATVVEGNVFTGVFICSVHVGVGEGNITCIMG